jgi:hypothetical protein
MPREILLKKVNLLALFAFLALVLVIGCGGGGGGGGNGSGDGGNDGGNGGSFDQIVLEAVLASNPNTFVDPANIQVGDTVQFQVAGYKSGARTVLPAGPFTTTDATNSVGTLSATGLFTATASSNTQFTVSTSAAGANRTRNYLVKPTQALVSGTVVDSNGRAVFDALVRIISGSNLIVATGRTGVDGRFRISTPATGATVNIDPVSLSATTYYKSFILSSKRYTTLDVACSAPLPPLGIGSTVGAGTLIVDTVRNIGGGINVPPPPPDGCS